MHFDVYAAIRTSSLAAVEAAVLADFHARAERARVRELAGADERCSLPTEPPPAS
jgi:hypothetical protein